MKKNLKLLLIALLGAVMLISGCKKDTILTYDGALKFTGLSEDFSIDYNDIYAMDAITVNVKNVSSEGEEALYEVTGILLDTLLAEHGYSQQDMGSIRLVAGDGYAIDIPQDIVQSKDIILAYIFDGEKLDDKAMPLRAAIDDVRSMYYASNLSEIQFSPAQEEAIEEDYSITKIVLMETACLDIDTKSYTYYDSEDTAVLAADLLGTYVVVKPEKVYLTASDGYEKTESFDVINDGYIKITGNDIPLFTGKDLPKGMNVKSIMNMQVGNISFVSAESCIAGIENKTVEDVAGAALDKVIEMAGLEGDYYVFIARDGFSVEVQAESLSDAVLYYSELGSCGVKFPEDYPRNYSLRNLIAIEIGTGESLADTSDTEDGSETDDKYSKDEEGTEDVDSISGIALQDWTIIFEGLSDGSFEMTSERAQRKLTLVDLHTERIKNDDAIPEDWQGYKLLDMLSFLKVVEFEGVIITAGDEYEVELTKDMIDEETILAVVKDGEALTDSDNLVQLVQNSEFATTWVKGVTKITVY